MADDEAIAEIAKQLETTPWFKRQWVTIALAAALGAMLLAMLGGGLLYTRKVKTLQTEIVTLKKDLKARAQSHDALQEQIVALSGQLGLLKAHAAAHSPSEVGTAKDAQADNQASVPVAGVEKAAAIIPSVAGGEKKIIDTAKPESKTPVTPEKQVTPAPAARENKLVDGKPVPGTTSGAVAPATKSGRAEPEGIRCEFAGKTAEQQAEMLKRCVSVMESPPKSRPSK